MASIFRLIFWWTGEQVNRCIFRMKSLKMEINRWTKRVCRRFLPIDRYSRYRLNQTSIYRFLSVYRSTNRYRFLWIDYWALSDWSNSQGKHCQSYTVKAVLKINFYSPCAFCFFVRFFVRFFLIASKTKNVQRSNKIFHLFNCLFSLDLLACFNNLSLSFINKAGAPNENIAQNHLNIALLSAF